MALFCFFLFATFALLTTTLVVRAEGFSYFSLRSQANGGGAARAKGFFSLRSLCSQRPRSFALGAFVCCVRCAHNDLDRSR